MNLLLLWSDASQKPQCSNSKVQVHIVTHTLLVVELCITVSVDLFPSVAVLTFLVVMCFINWLN